MLKMLRDNILVKEMTKEQLGKIILPQNVQDDDWSRGKVVAVGPGLKELGKVVTLEVSVDDIIVYPPMPGGGRYPTVSIDGEDYIIFNEKFVWAIEETKDAD